MMINAFDRKLLCALQSGLPLSPAPYRDLAAQVGITTDELLTVLKQWKADGKIRRIGAILNHFRTNHGCGAMVLWHVPEDCINTVGTLFSGLANVSHVYQRAAKPQWPYNLYTMVHAADVDEMNAAIETMSTQSGMTEFRALKTVKELKKVSPTYIEQQEKQE